MAKRLRANPALPMCPTHDHGNIYSYEADDGEMGYRCIHQEHDPLWGSGEQLLRAATRNRWSYDELQAAAGNKKDRQMTRPQVVKEDAMDATVATPTDTTSGNISEVVSAAKAKGMSMKDLATKANVNLGSIYNALRAHKTGKVIYSAKFIAALTGALKD